VLDDRGYCGARAAEERVIAMASRHLRVRAVHLELAARYDAIARGGSLPRRWIIGDRQKDATTGCPSQAETTAVAEISPNVTRMSARRGR
jgi:hypothetical protein